MQQISVVHYSRQLDGGLVKGFEPHQGEGECPLDPTATAVARILRCTVCAGIFVHGKQIGLHRGWRRVSTIGRADGGDRESCICRLISLEDAEGERNGS